MQASTIIQGQYTTPDGLTVYTFHSPRLNLRWEVAYHNGLPYANDARLTRAENRVNGQAGRGYAEIRQEVMGVDNA